MSPDPYNKNLLDDVDLGIAGKIAKSYIKSPLSLLIYMVLLVLGIAGLFLTPRQEDPQISVPMVDIMLNYPGASSDQVEKLAVDPLEKVMFGIKGVKHVYSAIERGQAVVTIQFKVGQPMGPSLVKVNDAIKSNMDKMPPGLMQPFTKSVSIDDVPLVTVTFWSKDLNNDGTPDVNDNQLRILAQDVLQKIKEIPETGRDYIVGGRKEIVKVEVMPAKLSGYGVTLRQVTGAITMANHEGNVGNIESGGSSFSVSTGGYLKSAHQIESLVVGNFNGRPVHVYDVAKVIKGPEDSKQIVNYFTGPAAQIDTKANGVPAVTIGIAKKERTNGVAVAKDIEKKLNELEGVLIPDNVVASITRNYGDTASEKVNELILKLFKATGIVFILVLFAFRAFKPALVVLAVIPVVLLFTIFAAYILGFTIDRVSLFALIFSIGILVDDAIVVVENIYRRWLEAKSTDDDIAVDAVREVGNPTILATGTVIAALMPMAVVSGMMGPYMLPIPVLGSVAMIISLLAAFMFTPWLAASEKLRPSFKYLEAAEAREHKEAEWLESIYRWILIPLYQNPFIRLLFKIGLWGGLILACSMFYFKAVKVKMLPLDNKPEFSVMIDMPDGTALPSTANLANTLANEVRKIKEVTAVQVYAGTSRPFDFNGMVRHYYLRNRAWQGELQVQLTNKHDRDKTSHELAEEARESLNKLLATTSYKDAVLTVVEMPPGPPVLQAVVADIHGPDAATRRQFAKEMTEMFKEAPSLVDVDNYMRDSYYYWRFVVDVDKANRRGISVKVINENIAMALGGQPIGDIKPNKSAREATNIYIQVPMAERSQITRLTDLPIMNEQTHQTVSLGELGRFIKVQEESLIYHKDLRGVEYVVADVTDKKGEPAAPVYGMLQVQDIIKEKGYKAPDGVSPNPGIIDGWFAPPENDKRSAYEWTGEWTVTYETFRDMGGAFMAALLVIYMLVVWEFGNFKVPGLIMAPIPLTLLGIIPAHWMLDAEFTATSMIGWIALAGIIVRNSILLVDFSAHEVGGGSSVQEAVINACKTRTRPIVITALALMGGSAFILNDPIFQGMAISLIFGGAVSTLLTLVVIPLGCLQSSLSLCEVAQGHTPLGVVATPDGHVHIDEYKAIAKEKKPSIIIAILLLPFKIIQFILPPYSTTTTKVPPRAPRPPRPPRKPVETKAEEKEESKETEAEIEEAPKVEEKKPATTKKVTKKKVVKKKVTKKKKVAKKTSNRRGIQLKDADNEDDNGLN